MMTANQIAAVQDKRKAWVAAGLTTLGAERKRAAQGHLGIGSQKEDPAGYARRWRRYHGLVKKEAA